MFATALKFMRYDKAKSIGIIIGIVISIFLIGQQLGILGFLTGMMGGLVDNSRADIGQIWVVDNITRNANELAKIDEGMAGAIRSIEGVQNTYPVVLANASVKFENGKTGSVILVGSEAPLFIAGPTNDLIQDGQLMNLNDEGAVSAEYYDEDAFNTSLAVGSRLEINGKEAFIKVQTKNARSFSGALMYTSLSKARFYGGFPDNKISVVAVQVKPGYDIKNVVDNINKSIYGVRAWDAQVLKNETVSYLTISSNIGTSVGSLVVFAIISGFFIIGLTLYSSALDRIKDYGTLKAIGATNGYVRNLILTQSFLFAIVGYILAFVLLQLFRIGVEGAGLVFHYSLVQLTAMFVITVFISVGGSLFAVRKINSVEPASVFRG
ncbi:ABC transporter permease [Sphingobacterium faecium]|uniref:ABC transporter permease n=1 Tax=Sphingobacterium faecium TaxID=34087 RepID=UPI00320B6B6D